MQNGSVWVIPACAGCTHAASPSIQGARSPGPAALGTASPIPCQELPRSTGIASTPGCVLRMIHRRSRKHHTIKQASSFRWSLTRMFVKEAAAGGGWPERSASPAAMPCILLRATFLAHLCLLHLELRYWQPHHTRHKTNRVWKGLRRQLESSVSIEIPIISMQISATATVGKWFFTDLHFLSSKILHMHYTFYQKGLIVFSKFSKMHVHTLVVLNIVLVRLNIFNQLN